MTDPRIIQFSPRPWHSIPSPQGDVIADGNGRTIALVADALDGEGTDVLRADARLLVRAPTYHALALQTAELADKLLQNWQENPTIKRDIRLLRDVANVLLVETAQPSERP